MAEASERLRSGLALLMGEPGYGLIGIPSPDPNGPFLHDVNQPEPWWRGLETPSGERHVLSRPQAPFWRLGKLLSQQL
jgi:hypothetical protein